MLETDHDVSAGSGLGNITEEDRLQWGQGEGINMNDLFSSNEETVSNEGTEETVSGNKASENGINKLLIHKRYTSPNVFGDQIGDVGGMDAIDGLPPWTKNSSGVTGVLSVKDTTYSDEEHLSTSSVPFSGLRPTPSRGGGVNLLRPASLSAVGHAVTTGDTDADFLLNDGAREITDEDRITLGHYDGWPGKLSDVDTGLPHMTEES